jgi:hypothetical protein
MIAEQSKARFAVSVVEMMVVYILPQVGGFYFFSKLFGV